VLSIIIEYSEDKMLASEVLNIDILTGTARNAWLRNASFLPMLQKQGYSEAEV